MVIAGVSGPDGAGKTSLVADLRHQLEAEGIDVSRIYLYGCVACRRSSRPGIAAHVRNGRRPDGRRGFLRQAHALVDVAELAIRLLFAASGRPTVLLTDRSPLDGLVKHDPNGQTLAGRLYSYAARRYSVILLLDAPAAILAARDAEHSEAYLERKRSDFQTASKSLSNVTLVHFETSDRAMMRERVGYLLEALRHRGDPSEAARRAP